MTTIVTGSFPSIFPQAARATSLCLDASGNLVLGVYGQTSGAPGSGSAVGPYLLEYTAATSGWQLGPEFLTSVGSYLYSSSGTILCGDNGEPLIIAGSAPAVLTQIVGVQTGWGLDLTAGLLPWSTSGVGASVAGAPPYVALVSGASGVYAFNTTGVWNQDGGFIAGSAPLAGIRTAFASGAQLYALASGTVWSLALTTSASATVTSAALPVGVVGTCIGPAPGSALAVGGWVTGGLASGAYALAMDPTTTILLTLPGSQTAATWVLTGSPPALHFFTSTTGLPVYSTNIDVEFTRLGSQVLLNDAGQETWAAFSYIGGVLGLLSSGSLTGQVAGIAGDSSSSYAVIAQPGASGYAAIYASGAGWVSSGTVVTGLPGACAPHLLSGQVWAVGSSASGGCACMLVYSTLADSWNLAPFVTGLGWTPFSFASDPWTSKLWITASGGAEGISLGNSPVGGLIASGSWISSPPSGAIGSPLVIRNQFLQPTVGPSGIAIAGQTTATGINPIGFQPLTFAPTAIIGPFANGTIVIGSASGMALWGFQQPWSIAPIQSGVWLSFSGGSFSSATGLGEFQVPSCITLDASGNSVVATTAGYLGGLTGVPSSLVSVRPSGGYSAGFVASGTLWLSSTVAGILGIST